MLIITLVSGLNANRVQAQVWTEEFLPINSVPNGSANGYAGFNGIWTETHLLGDTGVYKNQFYISCQEAGMHINNCGDACQPVPLPPPTPYIGQSLHIGSPLTILGDNGALYYAGGGGVSNTDGSTDVRAESPTIDCSGYSNLGLTFNYIEYGDGSNDNAEVWYFDGSTWFFLYDMSKTNCGDGIGGSCNIVPCDGLKKGYWSASPTIILPISADNNPNVKIGFRWVNNDDGVGTNPSIAITKIQLSNNVVGLKAYTFGNSITLYPNPTETNTTLEINTPYNETVVVLIYNGLGQLVSGENIKLTVGNNKKEIATQKLLSGLHTIKVVGNGVQGVKQFIKE